jgi:hypothetical protein
MRRALLQQALALLLFISPASSQVLSGAAFGEQRPAEGGGCSGSAVTASIVSHRSSGVAPLAVSFDLTGTTNTGGYNNFGEITYDVTFDDAGSGTWAVDGRSKNAALGPVVAHTFRTPGTYTVEVTATDAAGNCDTATTTVTVSDPDTAFAGTSTICVGNSLPTAGVGGCPTGAAVAASSDYDAALATDCNVDAVAVRCLFKGGDTFTASTFVNVAHAGPTIIGNYGSGQAILIATTADETIRLDASVPTTDIRIFGFNVTKDSVSTGSVAFVSKVNAGNLQDVLLMDVTGANGSAAILANQLHAGVFFDTVTWTPCTGGSGNGCISFQGDPWAVMGSDLQDSTAAEWPMRVLRGGRGYMTSSYLATAAATKNVLKFHGTTVANSSTKNNINFSSFIGNANSSIPVQFSPQTDGFDEQITHLVFDSNYVKNVDANGGAAKFSLVEGLWVRNNVMVGGGFDCITVARRSGSGTDPTNMSDAHVYNNTCYSGGSDDQAVFINDAHVSAPRECANNLLITTAGAPDPATGCTEQDVDNVQSTSTSILTTTPPLTLLDAKLQAGATSVIDQGTAVDGVRYDFEGGARSTIDIGADEFGAP